MELIKCLLLERAFKRFGTQIHPLRNKDIYDFTYEEGNYMLWYDTADESTHLEVIREDEDEFYGIFTNECE